jgi:hypothetical protein
VAYLAGALTLAFVVFGWPLWPFGIILIFGLLAADIAIET